jgi:hypothetical protein
MSNHYHFVLHVDQARVAEWPQEQVVARWEALFGVPTIVERSREGLAGQAGREAAEQLIERWRARLRDVSWYMRCLNEHLARRATEDQYTGRFWEGTSSVAPSVSSITYGCMPACSASPGSKGFDRPNGYIEPRKTLARTSSFLPVVQRCSPVIALRKRNRQL